MSPRNSGAIAAKQLFSRVKSADLTTPLNPHQQRVTDKLKATMQYGPTGGGLLVAHSVGKGKTLSAIAAQQALDMPADVVVPAPLVNNYEKELEKHTGGQHRPVRIRSYEKAVPEGVDPSGMVVFDEAHRGRNAGTATAGLLRSARSAKARLLLTGTPIYNDPADLGAMLNAATGQQRFPNNPKDFAARYVQERKVDPGFFARLFGAQPGSYRELKNREDLIQRSRGYIDVESGRGPDFPSVEEKDIDVPMSDAQHAVYRYHEGRLPFWLRFKVKNNLPLSKLESQDLNKFYAGMRQSSDSPRPYSAGMTDAQEDEAAPKLKAIVDRIEEMRKQNPQYRGLLYSNYLEAGLNPMGRMLQQRGIPYGMFSGGLSKADRKELVRRYNEGVDPVLMVSSAGSEGLDLKGTRHVVITEPHFNESKIQQIVGRAARYKSHAALPEDQRNVLVERYRSTKPKSLLNRYGLGRPATAIDQFLESRAKEKELLTQQIMSAMQEASDAGPLRPEWLQR